MAIHKVLRKKKIGQKKKFYQGQKHIFMLKHLGTGKFHSDFSFRNNS